MDALNNARHPLLNHPPDPIKHRFKAVIAASQGINYFYIQYVNAVRPLNIDTLGTSIKAAVEEFLEGDELLVLSVANGHASQCKYSAAPGLFGFLLVFNHV